MKSSCMPRFIISNRVSVASKKNFERMRGKSYSLSSITILTSLLLHKMFTWTSDFGEVYIPIYPPLLCPCLVDHKHLVKLSCLVNSCKPVRIKIHYNMVNLCTNTKWFFLGLSVEVLQLYYNYPLLSAAILFCS